MSFLATESRKVSHLILVEKSYGPLLLESGFIFLVFLFGVHMHLEV